MSEQARLSDAAGEPSAASHLSTGSGRPRAASGFWLTGYTFAVSMAFAALPAPLYVLYQARDHFGPLLVTLIFAAYPVGVVGSLLLAGGVSDYRGRRSLIWASIAFSVLSGLVMIFWTAVPGLVLGRLLAGVGVGMLNATATAYLSELHAAARPGAGPARAVIVATAANLGGIGFGALLGGVLAQYAPAPLVLPYLAAIALMLAGAAVLAAVPETVTRPERRPRYRPQRIMVPPASRALYAAAGLAASAQFALFGLFTSLAPGIIADDLGNHSHALAGLAAFGVFAAAALAQVAAGRARLARQLGAGTAALAVGLVAITVAVWISSLPLLLLGGLVAGAGTGAGFKGSTSLIIAIAPPANRGEALAGVFVAAYVGLGVPVVGLGLLAQFIDVRIAVLGFTALLIAAAGAGAARLLRPGALAAAGISE